MITGFNTDIEYAGVVYHVQTEDKGLNSPLILSLVYSGGAILASKRSPYQDLIAAGFNEGTLAERLKRQHLLICAAIKAGRIDELKRMNSRAGESAPLSLPLPPVKADNTRDEDVTIESSEQPAGPEPKFEPSMPSESPAEHKPHSAVNAYSIYDPRRQSVSIESPEEGLLIRILDERDFQAGDSVTLRIMVGYRTSGKEKPKAGVVVSVKVLGTTFRPQIYSVTTQRNGVALLPLQIPAFTSGRAAILVRAEVDADSVEIRRVIHSWH